MKLISQEPIFDSKIDNGLGKSHFHYRLGNRSHKWRPPTDVYETQEAVIVRIEIAGMRDSDFSITLSQRTLSIQGIRPDSDDRSTYHQMEIRFGEFLSEITLYWDVDSQSVQAEYKDGFLRLILPKPEPHKVKIHK